MKKLNNKKIITIFDLSKLLMVVPITDMHWACGCINFEAKEIQFYDSMTRKMHSDIFFNIIKQYLVDEYVDKKLKYNTLNLNKWKCIDFKGIYNQQRNRYDSGIYALKAIESLLSNQFPNFNDSQIITFRKQIMLSIYYQSIKK